MMTLGTNDELVSVRAAGPNDNIILVTRNGQALRFEQEEVRLFLNRGGMGVRGMKLLNRDRVVSMDVGPPSAKLLVISTLGFGKITPLSSYRKKGRAGQGVRTLKITDKTGPVADARVIDDSKGSVHRLRAGTDAEDTSLRDKEHGPRSAGRDDLQARQGRRRRLDQLCQRPEHPGRGRGPRQPPTAVATVAPTVLSQSCCRGRVGWRFWS